jgi:hypothetical protein
MFGQEFDSPHLHNSIFGQPDSIGVISTDIMDGLSAVHPFFLLRNLSLPAPVHGEADIY